MINNNIFSSTLIPGGYSWTIVSRFGSILAEVEESFGKRDENYTILGIELNDCGNPQFWFPGNCGNVIIQITDDCIKDMNQAIFQVAHEAVHCLNPIIVGNATYLEEGLATYFSLHFCRENNINISCSNTKYQLASDLVAELLLQDNNAIKKLRGDGLISLSSITREMITEKYPDIDKELAKKLTTNFSIDLH